MKRTLFALAGIVCCLGLNVMPLQAGTGGISGNKVNLSVQFTYRETDPDAWRALFEEANHLLYNATNGQLQLGTIRVNNCGGAREESDIWIQNNNSGAFANILGLGGLGHIYLSQTHKSTTEPALGQFGLVHEFGHYGFGLYDEYKGISAPALLAQGPGGEQTGLDVPNQFCVLPGDTVSSIMDGGTTVFPKNRRTEFCTDTAGGLSTAHNSGVVVDGMRYINSQQAYNGESCWQTIARVAHLQPPSEVDPTQPGGLQAIDWQIVPDLNRVVICIDASASMFTRPAQITLARQVAELIVNLLQGRKTVSFDGTPVTLSGDNLGLVTFSRQAGTVFPMREIVDQATRDSAAAVIAAITSSGAGDLSTDVAAAVRTSLLQIENQGSVPACGESVILLSDGKQNAGTDPQGVISDLRARGVKVYPVALGKGANADFMKQFADSTGGRFFQAASFEDVGGVAGDIALAVREAGMMQTVDDSTSGQNESITILADGFAEEIAFLLQWDRGTLNMTLTSPSGEVIDVASAQSRPDAEAMQDSTIVYLRLIHPEAGAWVANLTPVDVPSTIHYRLSVNDVSRSAQVTASVTPATVQAPAPLRLRVDVIAGVPVAGADVTATVDRPYGGPVTIQLFDDGQAAHGDTWAHDGTYGGLFSAYTANGTYTFHVRAVNQTGTGPDPNLPFVEEGPGPPTSVAPFTREAVTTAEVTGIAGTAPATLDANPKTLNANNPQGKVTCYLELSPPHSVSEIDLATVLLNSSLRPSPPLTIGDHDADGIPDLTLKFDRGAVIDFLPDGVRAQLFVSGYLNSAIAFSAGDSISVIHPGEHPVQVSPDTLGAGANAVIRWDPVAGDPVTYSGFLSTDGGQRWEPLFGGVQGNEYNWIVTQVFTGPARVLVQADSPEGTLGQDASAPLLLLSDPAAGPGEPTRNAFLGASPNPAFGPATFRYSLAREGRVDLSVYEIGGRLVRHLVASRQGPGRYSVDWDGTDPGGRRVAAGMYLYVFDAEGAQSRGRLLIIR
jgi:hypothetical protein